MKFLGQAKKFFKVLQTEPEPKVQHFNVRCASGHRVRGERTEGYQALRCPACGEGVFVLPRSPLPSPQAPDRPAASRSERTTKPTVEDWPVELTDPASVSVDLGGDELPAADADIIWDDALPEPPPRVPPEPARARADAVDVGIAGPPEAAAREHGRSSAAPGGQENRVRRQGDSKPKQRPPQTRSPEKTHGTASRGHRLSQGPEAATAGEPAEAVATARQSWCTKSSQPDGSRRFIASCS